MNVQQLCKMVESRSASESDISSREDVSSREDSSSREDTSSCEDVSSEASSGDDSSSRNDTEISLASREGKEAVRIRHTPTIDDKFFKYPFNPVMRPHGSSYRMLINPRCTTQNKLVSPQSVVRFCLQGNHFAASQINLKLSRRPLKDFSGWSRFMLGHDRVRAALNSAQVTRAVQAAGDLIITHDIPGMISLLIRWCIPTHTFICRWGEFTITLEDVVALLHLPVTGNFPGELSAEEKEISDVLEAKMHELNKSPSSCYARWLSYWWPRDRPLPYPVDSIFMIAALLCLWLSRDIFEDRRALLKPFVIHFAIKMAKGEKVPIGSLFLGSLYANLDSLAVDSSISDGFMKVDTYVNTMFLQALMWEHLESYAPVPRNSFPGRKVDTRDSLLEENDARIMRWSRKKPRSDTCFTDILDMENEFNFRPWQSVPPLFSQLVTFNTADENIKLKTGAGLSEGERSFILSCTPGFLISIMGGEFQMEEYNIDRAARQMGLDQCIPSYRTNKPEIEYLKAHLDCTHVEGNEYLSPRPDWESFVTPGYKSFWRQQLLRVFDFVSEIQSPVREFPTRDVISSRPRLKYLSGADKRKTSPNASQVSVPSHDFM